MGGFGKTRVMNVVVLVFIPVLTLKSIVSLVGPNWDWPFVPVIVLLLATAAVTYSALGKLSPRRTTIAVYLNWICLVFSAAGAVATLNYTGSGAGTLGALAGLVPWGINLKALYSQRGQYMQAGQSPAPN